MINCVVHEVMGVRYVSGLIAGFTRTHWTYEGKGGLRLSLCKRGAGLTVDQAPWLPDCWLCNKKLASLIKKGAKSR